MSTTHRLQSVPVPMIRTKYLGPTDCRGSRIKAVSVGAGDRPGFRLTVGYRSELNSDENHESAALALRANIISSEGLPEWPHRIVRCSEDGGGYVFAFVPKGDA